MTGVPQRSGDAAIYCERLTAASVAALRAAGARRVVVLEELDAASGPHRVALERLGVVVEESSFFAGHLRNPDGEAVYLAARRLAGVLALRGAAPLVARVPVLARANARYGRNTVRLYLAKTLALPVERAILRQMVARALSGGPTTCWLERPATFDESLVADAVPGVTTRFYSVPTHRYRAIARTIAVGAARRARTWFGPRMATRPTGPSVLMVREDDLGTDRSYRSQPHWLDPDDAPPSFETFVLPRGGRPSESDPARRDRIRLRLLERADVGRARQAAPASLAPLARDARACLRAAFTTRSAVEAAALLQGWTLLERAREVGAVAHWLGTRVVVVGEPYVIETDAMQLASGLLGGSTVAFQYSNLAFMSPLMLTTADHMVLFAPMFREIWEADGVAPQRFETGGYLYDNVFEKVRTRAGALRAELRAAGAQFVFCYFDESVQHDRWGCISEDEHFEELLALVELVAEDPSVGLVVKTQFDGNSPSRRYADHPAFAAAIASGRYAELRFGTHRNLVFPAEAAMAADVCVGHAAGATASLEGALAGCRSVLLNPYGLRTPWDDLYRQADIFYPSLPALLEAVRAYRAGDASRRGLGDWTPVRGHFDSFADGGAGARLRSLVETLLSGDATARNPELAGIT